LVYDGNNQQPVIGYSDADWAANLDDRRSITVYAFIMANGAISWNSKKQPTVALSSTEAEYMAASQATKEATWIRKLLDSLGLAKPEAMLIYGDNQGSIALAKNPTGHGRTKHIDIQHHFIREKVNGGEIQFEFCGTENMIADVLTKGLPQEKHNHCVKGLGIQVTGSTHRVGVLENGDSAPVVAELDGVISGDLKSCGV
jgi:hypothetical protein